MAAYDLLCSFCAGMCRVKVQGGKGMEGAFVHACGLKRVE
jgi:hypothetical protein